MMLLIVVLIKKNNNNVNISNNVMVSSTPTMPIIPIIPILANMPTPQVSTPLASIQQPTTPVIANTPIIAAPSPIIAIQTPLIDNSKDNEFASSEKYLPTANIVRIMKKSLPPNAKISRDAKDAIQECVSEFISYVTGDKRKMYTR